MTIEMVLESDGRRRTIKEHMAPNNYAEAASMFNWWLLRLFTFFFFIIIKVGICVLSCNPYYCKCNDHEVKQIYIHILIFNHIFRLCRDIICILSPTYPFCALFIQLIILVEYFYTFILVSPFTFYLWSVANFSSWFLCCSLLHDASWLELMSILTLQVLLM